MQCVCNKLKLHAHRKNQATAFQKGDRKSDPYSGWVFLNKHNFIFFLKSLIFNMCDDYTYIPNIFQKSSSFISWLQHMKFIRLSFFFPLLK